MCEIATGNGVCTLRAAIQEATAQPANDTISFDIPQSDPGYDGTSWTVSLSSALPDLSTNLTVDGPGANLLTVTRVSLDAFRIFHVTTSGTVSFSGLTMTNGASSGNGGAILSDGGATVNVINCTLTGNYGLRGGGISNQGTSTLNVTGCTVSNNNSTRGGGITNQDAGTVNVTNSTIYGNNGADGGGIRKSDVGTVNVSGCTITQNIGHGLFNATPNGSFNVKSSIVSLNFAGQLNAEVFGNFSSLGFNLITITDGSTGFTQPTDKVGTHDLPILAGLDPNGLQDNGGPTQTVALLAGSLAIDAGTSEGLTGDLTTDQRGEGFLRSFDDPAIPNTAGGDGTDIGAFEAQASLLVPARLGNISTRLSVEAGENVAIGGFIITGTGVKNVIVRAIGPSLASHGVTGALADPMLELHDLSGATIASNDNWRDTQESEIEATGIPPTDDLESALVQSLVPGSYTAVVSSVTGTPGIGLVEIYDLDPPADSQLSNISTRGNVHTADAVMIGGIIILGQTPSNILVRALGPSLPLEGVLVDPALDLHDANGALISSNDNWKDTQQSEIESTGIPPTNDAEAALLMVLTPGSYTAVVRGENDTTGVALVEAYFLPD